MVGLSSHLGIGPDGARSDKASYSLEHYGELANIRVTKSSTADIELYAFADYAAPIFLLRPLRRMAQ